MNTVLMLAFVLFPGSAVPGADTFTSSGSVKTTETNYENATTVLPDSSGSRKKVSNGDCSYQRGTTC